MKIQITTCRCSGNCTHVHAARSMRADGSVLTVLERKARAGDEALPLATLFARVEHVALYTHEVSHADRLGWHEIGDYFCLFSTSAENISDALAAVSREELDRLAERAETDTALAFVDGSQWSAAASNLLAAIRGDIAARAEFERDCEFAHRLEKAVVSGSFSMPEKRALKEARARAESFFSVSTQPAHRGLGWWLVGVGECMRVTALAGARDKKCRESIYRTKLRKLLQLEARLRAI